MGETGSHLWMSFLQMKWLHQLMAGAWIVCSIAALILGDYWTGCVSKCVAAEPPAPTPTPVEWEGIENVFRLSPRVSSGSGPSSHLAFQSIAESGVRTIVSVDGVEPKVELAREHGLRYVHIPIGYDGLSREATLSLVRVMRECEGPVYVHCHHGKHRGPAAAAVACMAEGAVDHRGARQILVAAGAGKNYRGLWRDVAEFQMPTADEPLPELVEVAELQGRVQAMAQLGAAMENLERLAANDWQPLAEHPDITATHESLLIWEGLRESQRHSDAGATELDSRFNSAASNANRLRERLKAGDWDAATRQLAALRSSCTDCHWEHRDNR